MAPKIFATGVTGYIGGTVLDTILKAHPDYSVTALVRSEDKAGLVRSAYPSVQTVIGDLDSTDIIASAVKEADIVLHTADCDHVASATAIVNALASSATPKFLIHTSGSAVLVDLRASDSIGAAVKPEQEYSDVGSISAIISFPVDSHPHRNVDAIILGAPPHVHTAIVCPPCIYGEGTGPGNRSSAQVPLLIQRTLKRGKGFTVAGGNNQWNNVHVLDLAQVFLKLTEAAAERAGEGADWDQDGYYFAENGAQLWGDVAREIAKRAKALGYLSTDQVDDLSVDNVLELHPFGHILWGSNSKGKAERARNRLGWVPKEAALEDTLDATIEKEAKAMGL